MAYGYDKKMKVVKPKKKNNKKTKAKKSKGY